MSEPDLQFAGLSIWVHGRAAPDASEYHEGNWLVVRTAMQLGQSSVAVEGSIVQTVDFKQFREELAAMQASLAGEASLSSYEPFLNITLHADRLGRIDGQIEITPDPYTELHRFNVSLDQSYLPALITACDALLKRFPVVGQP